jgi:hypothetical protein
MIIYKKEVDEYKILIMITLNYDDEFEINYDDD